MKIEVCVDNIESAIIAEQAGADRIELCTALPLGGLTPHYSLIKAATQKLSIPVYVMIRPRAGDFLFNADEQQMMIDDIEMAKQLGAAGVVIGALTVNAEIDIALTKMLMQSAQSLDVTFHRAFDLCRDPLHALQQLIELGCSRILTSGQAATAAQGQTLLTQLVQQAQQKISIMAGAGINADNALTIAQQTGVTELHLSGKSYRPSKMQYQNSQAAMGQNAKEDTQILVTDFAKINAVRKLF